MTVENVTRFSTTTTTPNNDYKCFNCQVPCVRGDPSLIRAMGNLYHKSCFTCHSCQISVVDKFYIMESTAIPTKQDHVILCERDYYNQNKSKCHQCNQFITDNHYETVGIYKYHKHCLHCPGCIITKSLPSLPSALPPQLVSSPASSSSSSAASLSSIITSNDEQQEKEDSLERFNYNNRPYCRYHYSLIKGTECTGCGQTVLFQHKETTDKWHTECFMLMKYYQVELNPLFHSHPSDIQSKTQLFTLQNEYQHMRNKIWKETSQFEDATFKIISNIVSIQHTDNKKVYEACQSLFKQINVLFSVLDCVFKYFTHLSLEASIQKISDQLIHFLDIICEQQQQEENKLELKFVNILSQSTRDLVKLSLQQTTLLERNFGGQDNDLIDQLIRVYSNKLVKRTMDVECLNHYLQLIDMSMTRLAFVFNILVEEKQQATTGIKDETILFKPTLFPLSTFNQQHRMIHNSSSTPNIQQQQQQQQYYLTKSSTSTDIYSSSACTSSVPTLTTNLTRSQSTYRNPPSINYYSSSLTNTPLPILTSTLTSASSSFVNITPSSSSSSTNIIQPTKHSSTSRMDSIRRALTTSRSSGKKEGLLSRSNSIFNNSSSRRDQRSFSLHNPNTPPLSISLPDVEQLNNHHFHQRTPPLSPPSAATINYQQILGNLAAVHHLPELTQQQDCILRHIAILYIESHASASSVEHLDDLLACLLEEETAKKSSSSLWGKLKTHILTPGALTAEASNPFNNPNLLNNNHTTATSPIAGGGEKKIGVSLSQQNNTSGGSLNTYKIPENCSTSFENWKTPCPSVMSCFSPNSYAPNFLKDCILAMIDQDVNMEGIFRKNGNIRLLKETCDQLNENHTRENWFDFFKEQHIIQLAAFVKRYLRELPEPLLTYKLHKLFLMSSTTNSEEEDLTMIHYAICMLPKINRDVLLLVLALLNWVARHSEDNKMDFENLARVMTPNILYNRGAKTCSVDVTQCHHEIRIVALMIQYYEIFVKVPSDFGVLLQHPKMSEYLCSNSIDLIDPKQFTKNFSNLSKLKKEVIASSSASSEPSTMLPPSPSTSK